MSKKKLDPPVVPNSWKSVNDFFVYLVFMLVVVAFFATLASGASVVPEVGLAEYSSLVTVDGALDFRPVLPGYSYQRDLVVSLNLSNEVLRGLNSKNVTVFVLVSSDTEEAPFYFSVDGRKGEKAVFQLFCIVSNERCSPTSLSSKVVEVSLTVPRNGLNSTVLVNASLTPFEAAADSGVVSSISQLEQRLGALKERLAELELLEEFSTRLDQLNASLSNARIHAAQGDEGTQQVVLTLGNDLNKLEQESEAPVSGNLFKNFSISWQALFLGVLLFVLVAVYYVYSRDNKRVDVDKFLRDVEK
ncbi:hypothetical protein HY571_01870 [Candidatus Micrarchaeota archaeon]|nr:hypothetical protein [Candidatus Micrarchaeota archaeon]